LDKALGSGIRDKTLDVVVAPSHGGKSALLIATAAETYLRGKNVLFISLEMTDFEISRRLDANIINHPANRLGELSYDEYTRKLNEAKKYAGKMVVKDYPSGVFSTLTLKSLINELETLEDFKPDLIVIDYLGLMNSTRTTLGKAGGYAFYKSIAEELHGFAKAYDLPVLTAAQLNRGAYDNVNSGLDSIADSLGVIQTADVVIAVLSNEQLRSEGQALLKLLKNRNTGQLSSHLVEVDFSKAQFRDMEEDANQESVKRINEQVLQAAVEGKVGKIDPSVIQFD
jgi:replicative DNA helicase